MSEQARSIDVTTSAILEQLAREVSDSRRPIQLTRDDEVVAVVQPAPKRRRRRTDTDADYEAFRSAAGAWRGVVDVEKFKEENRRQKLVSTRRPVEL